MCTINAPELFYSNYHLMHKTYIKASNIKFDMLWALKLEIPGKCPDIIQQKLSKYKFRLF